jgi:hypothetical protein
MYELPAFSPHLWHVIDVTERAPALFKSDPGSGATFFLDFFMGIVRRRSGFWHNRPRNAFQREEKSAFL